MPRAGTRMIPAPTPTILPATDLGRVEIAKHGNLYLLTDGQGDILNDGRGLGLYDLDTRILSTSILRLNGERLTLLRGPHASDGAVRAAARPRARRGPHCLQNRRLAFCVSCKSIEAAVSDRRGRTGTVGIWGRSWKFRASKSQSQATRPPRFASIASGCASALRGGAGTDSSILVSR